MDNHIFILLTTITIQMATLDHSSNNPEPTPNSRPSALQFSKCKIGTFITFKNHITISSVKLPFGTKKPLKSIQNTPLKTRMPTISAEWPQKIHNKKKKPKQMEVDISLLQLKKFQHSQNPLQGNIPLPQTLRNCNLTFGNPTRESNRLNQNLRPKC